MANTKATLGTESGSNIFDYTGEISAYVRNQLEINPTLSFQEVFDSYLYQFETNKVKMNQISPKIFESMALKVGLILFEGEYSDIIKPNIHYIPLKKNFSNIDEALTKVKNDDFLLTMTERAYNDIVKNKEYASASLIKELDDYFEYKLNHLHYNKVVEKFIVDLDNPLAYASKKIYYFDRAKNQLIEV